MYKIYVQVYASYYAQKHELNDTHMIMTATSMTWTDMALLTG